MDGLRAVANAPRPPQAERNWKTKMVEKPEMNQENRDQRAEPPNEAPGVPPDAPPLSGRVAVVAIVVLLILAVVLAIGGIVPRVRARTKLKNDTDALAAPAVIAHPPTQGKIGQEIIL